MKYKQFVAIRTAIIILLIVTPIVVLILVNRPDENEKDIETVGETKEESKEDNDNSATNITNDENYDHYQLFTSGHQIVLEHQKTSIEEGKPDDNNGGVKKWIEYNKNGTNSFFIDLRCDKQKGFDYFNRVKVDWDKDKLWDERWTFREDGSIERLVSTSDDNSTYNLTFELETETEHKIGEVAWFLKNSSSSSDLSDQNSTNHSTEKAEYKTDLTGNLTLAHQEIIALQNNTPISQGKPDNNNDGVKKWIEKSTYFVDLRCDKQKGFDYFNRVKLDWDKDKNWDEKWTFREDGSIKRVISTSDDNSTYDIEYELFSDGTSWIKK